jgi:hypothetical protein
VGGSAGASAGGASAGGSASAGSSGVGGSASAGGAAGSASAGGAGIGQASPSTTGSIATGAIAAPSVPGLTAGGISVGLPASLAPEEADPTGARRLLLYQPRFGSLWATAADLKRLQQPMVARPGTSTDTVVACRDAIVRAAMPYGVVSVDAASAGPTRRMRDGGLAAPVEMRVIYSRSRGYEGRQATISCRMNAAGQVVDAI